MELLYVWYRIDVVAILYDIVKQYDLADTLWGGAMLYNWFNMMKYDECKAEIRMICCDTISLNENLDICLLWRCCPQPLMDKSGTHIIQFKLTLLEALPNMRFSNHALW